MKIKIYFIAGILIFQIFQAHSQASTDTIRIIGYPSYRFVHNGKALGPGKLLETVKSNPEAYALLKRNLSRRTMGTIVGSIGGFLVGYALGGSLGDGILDKKMLATGGGLILLSIPIQGTYSSNAIKAVRIYNKGIKESRMEYLVE